MILNKLRELIDYLASDKAGRVVNNHRLEICGNGVVIKLNPKGGGDPIIITCKTEEALKQVEEILSSNKA